MFRRKKHSDFFPKKYYIWHSEDLYRYCNPPTDLLSRQDIFRNSADDAKVLAFSVKYNIGGDCILAIDFKDATAFHTFYQFCSQELRVRLIQISFGIVESELRTRGIANSFSHRPSCYTISTPNLINEKKSIIDNFLTAIHKTDSLDLYVIEKILDSYGFIDGLTNIQLCRDSIKNLQKKINKKINKAYTQGCMMGLFSQLNYPAELGHQIGTYLDVQDGINVALTSKLAAETGAQETIREMEIIISKNYFMK